MGQTMLIEWIKLGNAKESINYVYIYSCIYSLSSYIFKICIHMYFFFINNENDNFFRYRNWSKNDPNNQDLLDHQQHYNTKKIVCYQILKQLYEQIIHSSASRFLRCKCLWFSWTSCLLWLMVVLQTPLMASTTIAS